MKEYRTLYSNHVHLLLVSVSKHLYILKDRTLKYQKKKMEFSLKNLQKAERELVIHYLIFDHLSGLLYGEIHSSKRMIPVEEFLFRAWSKKANFEFCGLPTILSVPKTIENGELLNFITQLEIEPINPSGGFMGGVRHLNLWEKAVITHNLSYSFCNNQQLSFEELQRRNIEICIRLSQRKFNRNGVQLGPRVDVWESALRNIKLPPLRN